MRSPLSLAAVGAGFVHRAALTGLTEGLAVIGTVVDRRERRADQRRYHQQAIAEAQRTAMPTRRDYLPDDDGDDDDFDYYEDPYTDAPYRPRNGKREANNAAKLRRNYLN